MLDKRPKHTQEVGKKKGDNVKWENGRWRRGKLTHVGQDQGPGNMIFSCLLSSSFSEEEENGWSLPCHTLIDVPFIDALDWFLPFYTDMRAVAPPLFHPPAHLFFCSPSPPTWSLVQYVRRCLVPRLPVMIFITGGR